MLYPATKETSVYTVSQVNTKVKGLLEQNLGFIWVKGEISNFRNPASGHYYFTLKDDRGQLRAVMFRPQQRHLRFVPESGLEVICQGRISVYEPRGEYQLIVDVMEPQGIGALQLAFEQLKRKLEAEGLFDPGLKKEPPSCPQRLAVVTSPTGAAIRDILKVLQRSPYPISVTLLPVRVQGQEAAAEIAAAIAAANTLGKRFQWDLMIVGRGGGSIEDLWPFNEEIVARAIAAAAIPIVAAVGHEIDFTITDLVADLRTPTPTAAAEWVVAKLEHFQREISKHQDRLKQIMTQRLTAEKQRVQFFEKRLIDPKRRLADLRLFLDDRLDRLQLAMTRRLENLRTHHHHLRQSLFAKNPLKDIQHYRALVMQHLRTLTSSQQQSLERKRFELHRQAVQLETLSPLAVLARGYSITYRLPDLKVLREAGQVQQGQQVRVRLGKGVLECLVQKVDEASSASPTGRMLRGQKEN